MQVSSQKVEYFSSREIIGQTLQERGTTQRTVFRVNF